MRDNHEKIIKVADDFIVVADEDRNVTKIPTTAFDFAPVLNQKVEVYQLDDEFIVNEVKEVETYLSTQDTKASQFDAETLKEKIHINIINENNPQNFNSNYSSQTQYNYPNDYYQTGGVNKWLFILVALFLGGFGVNFFMIRRPFLGILCLLLFWTWIPAGIGVIHSLVALFKIPDYDGNIYF